VKLSAFLRKNTTEKEDAAVIVFSDKHLGSALAPWPVEVILSSGNEHKPNKVQEYLTSKENEWWIWARDLSKSRRITVIVNGDSCQGNWEKFGDMLETNRAYQRRAAITEFRKRKLPNDTWKIVRGTRVHDGPEGQDAESIAEALECKQNLIDGCFSYYILPMTINGIMINAVHYIGSSSSPISEFTALARILTKADQAASRWDIKAPDIWLAAHRHVYDESFYATSRGRRGVIITPAWVARGEYSSLIAPTEPSQIGGAVILIDKDGTWQNYSKVWSVPLPDREVV
jgi:hypothetical protein